MASEYKPQEAQLIGLCTVVQEMSSRLQEQLNNVLIVMLCSSMLV